METTINQVSPVEYELEVRATAEELKPELDKALRAQRQRTDIKGFRKGKVPLAMVKKMYGPALGLGIAEQFVQDAFSKEVVEANDLQVLGRPTMTELDYELDGDLRGVVRFGVRPEIELKELSGEQITALAYAVTDEDVEEEVEGLRQRNADLVPLEEDETVSEEHYIVFDVQELDAETGTPIIGQRDEDQSIFLDNPRIDQHPMMAELKKAVLGARSGDKIRFGFSHDEAHGEHPGGERHRHQFEVTIKDVKRRELRELDEEFVQEITDGQVENEEQLREEIRKELENTWKRQARNFLEGNIVERMLDLHGVPVPRSAVEVFLDSFVEDVKQRNDGELPENFDETAFREANLGEAERQARWMLIRDKVIEEEGLEVTDEDRERFFARLAERETGLTIEQLRGFYQQMPRLMEQMDQRLLSEKVYEALANRFDVVEKDADTIEQEMDVERERQTAGAASLEGEQGVLES